MAESKILNQDSFLARFLISDKNRLSLLSLTIILGIIRTTVPFANYVFLPVLACLAFVLAFTIFRVQSNTWRRILIDAWPLLLSAAFIFSGTLLSGWYRLVALKEALYTIMVLVLLAGLFIFIRSKQDFTRFTSLFKSQLVIFSIAIAVAGILKFILQLRGANLKFFQTEQVIAGTSLINDYNYYSLFSVLGLIALWFSRDRNQKFTAAAAVVLILNIAFSGSRRGIVLLVIAGLVIFVIGTGLRFNIRMLAKRLIWVAAILVAVMVTFVLLRNNTRFAHEKVSADLRTYRTNRLQKMSSQILYRYLTVLNYDRDYLHFYSRMWSFSSPFDTAMSYDKYEAGRNDGNLLYNSDFRHGLLFWEPEATSTRLSIVHEGKERQVRVERGDGDGTGWPLCYSGRDIVFYSGHRYELSFAFRVIKGSGVPFRAGFWADDGFSGYREASSLELKISELPEGWKNATCSHVFMQNHTGVPFFINSMTDSTVVEFKDIRLFDRDLKPGVPLFSDEYSSNSKIATELIEKKFPSRIQLTGMPEGNNLLYNGNFRSGTEFWTFNSDATIHEIIETPFGKGIRISRGDGDGGGFSLLYAGRPLVFHAGHEYMVKLMYRIVRGDGIPFSVGWWVEDEGQGYPAHRLNMKAVRVTNDWYEGKFSYRFGKTHSGLPFFLSELRDGSVVEIADIELTDSDRNDMIPLFADQLMTAGGQQEKNASASSGKIRKNLFYGPRAERWKYSLTIFADSLDTGEKIAGGGFRYMEMFGSKFGDVRYDYPHNPFLSALLYSGVPGLAAYVYFMFMVFLLFVRNRELHMFYLVSFVVVFYFSFFSVNTHFTLPVFAVFSAIPFLTRSLKDTETSE